jgi:hypothetical protein
MFNCVDAPDRLIERAILGNGFLVDVHQQVSSAHAADVFDNDKLEPVSVAFKHLLQIIPLLVRAHGPANCKTVFQEGTDNPDRDET